MVGLVQIENLLSDPDVVAALAAPPTVYGIDARPVDGSILEIVVDDKRFWVGEPCNGMAECTPPPTGVRALALQLGYLDDEQLARGDCAGKF